MLSSAKKRITRFHLISYKSHALRRFSAGGQHDVERVASSKLQSSNETSADNPNPLQRESFAVKLDPRAIFPWRHSPYPLPRLMPNTEEFVTQGGYIGPNMPPMNKFFRVMSWVNSAGFLGAKILNYVEWKQDLEYAFMHAFSVGVQGMLENVYLTHDDMGNTRENADEDSAEEDDEIDENAEEEINSSTITETFPIDFTHTIAPGHEYKSKYAAEEVECNHMLEPALISLYCSAHTSCKHKLQIKLQSKPKFAQVQSLFLVPFLTRAEVEDNVALKHSFRNIAKTLDRESNEVGRELSYYEIGNKVSEKLDDMSASQMKRRRKAGLDGDVVQMTIISQVSIQCDELFVVRDTDTGDIVQGNTNEGFEEVTHLVRFETVINLNMETRETEILGWQITDWDDLLDGNIWFS